MDVDSEQSNEDWMPALFVGWHSTQQRPDISSHFVEQARECNVSLNRSRKDRFIELILRASKCRLTNLPTV